CRPSQARHKYQGRRHADPSNAPTSVALPTHRRSPRAAPPSDSAPRGTGTSAIALAVSPRPRLAPPAIPSRAPAKAPDTSTVALYLTYRDAADREGEAREARSILI